MTSLYNQLRAFLYLLIMGLVTGLVYHFFSFLRRKLAGGWQHAADILFLILMLPLYLLMLLWAGWGELRYYYLPAFFLGIFFYFRCLTDSVSSFSVILYNIIIKIISFFSFDSGGK